MLGSMEHEQAFWQPTMGHEKASAILSPGAPAHKPLATPSVIGVIGPAGLVLCFFQSQLTASLALGQLKDHHQHLIEISSIFRPY